MYSLPLSIALLAVAAIFSVGFAFFPLKSKVKWHEELNGSTWRTLATVAALFAVAAIVVVFLGLPRHDDFWRVFVTSAAVGLTTVVMVYSFWTDIRVRKVDRRILVAAAWATLLTGAAYSITHWDPWTAMAAAGMIILGGLVYAGVPSIGASDARALILIGTAVVPIIGIRGFVDAVYVVCFAFIFFGAAMSIYKKQFNPEVSFPAVPILLGPFWVFLVASPYLGLAPGFLQ